MKTKKTTTVKESKVGRFCVGVTAVFVVATAVYLYSDAVEMSGLVKERAEIMAQIGEEEEKQVYLRNQRLYYESDSYIEKVAREKLGFVKPGDVIFIDRNSN